MQIRVTELGVLILTTAAAIVNFVTFGLVHYRTWSDAQEYSAYAANLLQTGVYGFDGVHFDIAREPGYPLFLALVYKIFGVENLLVVCFIQALLLGVLGYVVYRMFFESGYRNTGIVAGVLVSAHPSYGYYTNEILTELPFALVIAGILYVALRIVRSQDTAGYGWYATFGLLAGYASLMRMQFIFFLLYIAACYVTYMLWRARKNSGFASIPLRNVAKNTLVALAVFLVVVGSWGLYVRQHIGHFAITEGRQESVIHIRAVRAQLSYRELTQYAVEWVKRSVSGGAHYALLDANEAKGISERYFAIATTSGQIAAIKAHDLQTIRTHPGQYLYGNVIEVMKMAYIEHDYTDSQSRYFRPVVYAIMYAFFLFGVVMMVRNWRSRQLRTLTVLAFLFLFYNFAILSFFDTVPRFNTPYLMMYVIVGCVGVALFKRDRDRLQL